MGLAVSWAMPNGTQIFSNVVAWIAGAGLLAALAIGLGVPRHSQAMLEIGEPGMLEGPAVAMLEIGEPGMLEGPAVAMLEIGEPGMLEGPAVAMLEIGEPGMLEGPPITA